MDSKGNSQPRGTPPAIRTTARRPSGTLLGTLLSAVLLCACQSAPVSVPEVACAPASEEAGWRAPEVLAADGPIDFDNLVKRLHQPRAVLIGEYHPRYDHHLTQLEIICRLHARQPLLAIGMEAFQSPFQAHLDAYVAGQTDDDELLAGSDYFVRWRYDFRLYEPILRFARERGIPVLALNVPTEITGKVAEAGMQALLAEERAQIPNDIAPADDAYLARLRGVFERHPASESDSFERFMGVQLLWDEGMAARAADYLLRNPARKLVVLAGNHHVAYRSAIPGRLARRAGVATASVSQQLTRAADGIDADFQLVSAEQELPPAGKLGVLLQSESDGVVLKSVSDGGAAQAAGLEAGDRILTLAGRRVERFSDVRIALWRGRPGDTVALRVERGGVQLDYRLRLR